MTSKLLKCDLISNEELYQSYMPFIDKGAVFVRTEEAFNLGDEVILDLKLMDEPDRHTLRGIVIWVTPAGAQGGKPAGIGVQFTDDKSGHFRNKIETYLAGLLNSAKPTYTL
jgi:type IV pilus assembly protein PilZ